MKKFIPYIVIIVALGAVVAIGNYLIPKVRVVRMTYIFENYTGMAEANKKLQTHTDELNAQVDSLQIRFNATYNHYLSDTNNIDVYRNLYFIKKQLEEVKEVNQNKIKEYDDKLSIGVLNQVNTAIEQYCDEENVDILLGHLNGEGVLYALPAYDVTDDFLKQLNAKYEGEIDGE